MPFSNSDLTVLAYADGYTLWHYVTDDAAEDTKQSGYFEDARDVFRNNDRIEIFSGDTSFDAIITTVGRVRLRTA
jgi:hypothetical protein